MITEAKDAVVGRKIKTTLLSTEFNYDGNYVEYFGLDPGKSKGLLGNLTKPMTKIFMDIRVVNEVMQRVVYKIENFDGCAFLNNRVISRIFSRWYDAIVGNTTHFKCPARPGIYYLENGSTTGLVSPYLPAGTFRVSVRVKPVYGGPFAVEIIWRYMRK
ncbi:uncharacterized protein LOC108157931 [Drosophila miranda]|uniref:uncharacterized protein LOC108157931 n=1 Tax=Drosophila miranda TaxID=7229 RepID=UPI0007E5EF0C|nr:uncharacterized protein LOC108157931 [Drosophila miranda]